MASQKQLTTAQQVLKSYPQSAEVYFTSDGSCFVNKNHAQLHMRTLKDNVLVTVTKADVAAAGVQAPDARAQAKAAADANYQKQTVEQLKAQCAERQITIPDGAFKADIIALLEAADDK